MIEQINKIAEIWWSWMWPMFWQAGVLIVFLGVVDLVIRRRVWPQLRYALWLLVLVKLVLPPTFSLSTSLTSQLQPLAEQVLMRQTGIGGIAAVPNLERDLTTAKPLVNTSIGPSVISQETGKPDALVSANREAGIVAPAGAVKPSRQTYAMLIWLLGTLILATWLVVKLRQLRGAHRGKAEEDALPRWFGKLLADTAEKLNLRRLPKVAFSETVVCPAVFGIFRPILLLPKGNITGFSRKDTEHILLHELAHIKRGDLWVHSVYMVLQVVYWFNPMLWFVRRQLRHLRELCCDATVGRILQDKTADYRQTILENARRFLAETVEPGMGLLGLFEDSNRLLIRLKWLEKKTWKHQHLRSVTILAVVALMSACVLPMAKAQKSDKADMPVSSGADKGERIVGKSGSANAAAKPGPATTLRKIRDDWGRFANLSPDGKYVSDVDWDTSNLVVWELATGKVQTLTSKGSWKNEYPEYPFHSVISPDGQRVAYQWYYTETATFNLYTLGLDGSGRRLLRRNEYIVPRDWSPDGKNILAILFNKDANQIVWVSASDGSIQVIKTFDVKSFDKASPPNVDLSPDGRYIAYTLNGDIFLFAIAENREIPLVKHPDNDNLLGWTPDGKYVFFTSDRRGAWDAWLLQVAGGEPQGFPEIVKLDIGNVKPIGFTQSGSYYYRNEQRLNNVFVATLDLETGKVLSPPMPVRQTGATTCHDWSPDGQYLAYCTRSPDKLQVIHLRTLATGEERTLANNLPYFSYLRWSLDGQSILVTSFVGDPHEVICKIDVQTGERTDLVRSETERLGRCELSPDGKTLFYVRYDTDSKTARLVARDLKSGREKDLFRVVPSTRLGGGGLFALSPDGQRLVLSTGLISQPRATYPAAPALKIVSAAGGEPRELIQFEEEKMFLSGVAWTPDSQDVLFAKMFFGGGKGGKEGELWRVSAAGGEPRRLWVWKKQQFGRVRVHPDGRRIAFHSGSTPSELWLMENFLPTGVSQAK